MTLPVTALEPVEDVACTVCGDERRTMVLSAAEVEAQRRYLRLFHERRLRSQEGTPLAEKAEFTQDYATDVVACAACGLVYRDPRPSQQAIAQAYAGERYGAERLAQLFDSQLEHFRPKARVLRRWLSYPQPVIVEIGSFVGGFLCAMRERGAVVIGIDPGQEVAAFCAQEGLDVRCCTLDEAGIVPASVDCVAVWNTFDQLPRPQGTLATIARVLRRGGILGIRVPNGGFFKRALPWLRKGPKFSRHWCTVALAWNNLLAFPYLHGYSIANLDRLLESFGFRRFAFHPDVLTRLADDHTRWWAATEEMLVKSSLHAAASLDFVHEPRGSALAPWFHVYYRRRST